EKQLSSDVVLNSLKDFVDFENELIKIGIQTVRGDAIYLSNKIFNYDLIKPYIPFAFEYAYSYVSYLLLILKSLENGEMGIIALNNIIQYDASSGVSWNAGKVALGMRIVTDIHFNLSVVDYHNLLNIFVIPFYGILNCFFDENSVFYQDRGFLFKCYRELYRYVLSKKWKIVAKIIIDFSRIKIGFCFLKNCFYLREKIKTNKDGLKIGENEYGKLE
ncbi:MAG: hypothetical protein LUC98_14185, partial [Lachnospiraceae bacterium]|nr:hypothetical protein [Lachnospiraceae bacterium]